MAGGADPDCTELGAADLAALIRDGELSALAAVTAHIRRIEEVNPALNAVVVPLFEQARQDARDLDRARAAGAALGPLHGVPITVKECFEVAGTPATLGIANRRGHLAAANGPLVARLRAAGAVVLGKTNVSQLLQALDSDNPLYGRTRNPWRLDRSPGGSSGGEAAILAAHGSALGLGSDLGGSLRVPAHCCGVSSLKPTAGRLTRLGCGDHQRGQTVILDQAGPMARRVRDLALAMAVLAAPGAERFDPAVPPVPWREPGDVAVTGLRVGFYADDEVFACAPAIRRTVDEAARALGARGVEVTAFRPAAAAAAELFLGLLGADGAAGKRRLLAGGARDQQLAVNMAAARLPGVVRSVLAGVAALGGQRRLAAALRAWGRRSVPAYWRLVDAALAYRQDFLAAMDAQRLDALVCPAFPLPAVPHGAVHRLIFAHSYCLLFNLLGVPAGVVAASRVGPGEESDRANSRDASEAVARRAERGSTGLPVGVQVAARHWREDVVLAVMNELEAHFQRQPSYPDLGRSLDGRLHP
jgi:fatty acid amide hydrolase